MFLLLRGSRLLLVILPADVTFPMRVAALLSLLVTLQHLGVIAGYDVDAVWHLCCLMSH